jgi:Flp pilus assembly protein TadD
MYSWARTQSAKEIFMAFCSNCGTKLEEGMAFCAKCGTKVTVDSANTVPEQGAPQATQPVTDRQQPVQQQGQVTQTVARKKYSVKKIVLIAAIVAVIIGGVSALIEEMGTNPPAKTSPAVKLVREGGDLITQGNYSAAIEELTEAIKLDTNFPYSYYFRAIAYMNNGDVEKAFVDYQKAKTLYTRLAQADIGSEYLRKSGFENEINNLEEALNAK